MEAGRSFSRLWILRLEIMVVVRGGWGMGGPMRPGVKGEVRIAVVVLLLALVEWWEPAVRLPTGI